MFRFLGLCFGTLVRLLRSRQRLLENMVLRQQLVVLKRRHRRPRLGSVRQALLATRSSLLVRLERSTAGRHARNRCPMASRRIPLVLDGDFETQEAHRQKTHIAGGSGSELPNGRRESHLGCTTGNPDRESSGRRSNCGSACVSCSNIRERELRYVTPVRG